LALFGLMTFGFTFPGARGGYFHSGAALLPFIAVTAGVGLDALVEAAARRLRHWRPERSKPIFSALLAGVVIVISLSAFLVEVVGVTGSSQAWSSRDAVYAEAGQWLKDNAGPDVMVAVNNPPGWYYQTGQPAIVIPSDDVETLLQAMQAVGAQWLVLDANVSVGLTGLYLAPASEPRLALAATFANAGEHPVYLLQRVAGP
jgi:hypothetical protein